MTEKEQILNHLQKLDQEAFLESVQNAKAKTVALMMARKDRYSLGRIAFNIVMGVANDSDDFDCQPPEIQQRWEDAVKGANQFKKDHCFTCGHPWDDHEMGVPAPYCP